MLLHAPKSIAAVTALYGVLKAGASYVPVESNSPAPRLADIAVQCRPRCVVTGAAAREKLTPELCRKAGISSIYSLDDAEPFDDLPTQTFSVAEVMSQPAVAPDVKMIDQDLAYVLFTSGSTGTPKGVMLSHANALTFVDWATDTFQLRGDDRLSSHAPFNFDLSVLDLFGAVAVGASVTLIPEGLGMFPRRLAELIEREKLTVWYSVPSILTLLLTRGGSLDRELGSLRWILFAGEVFPTRHLRELMNALPNARYANLYGPTETNVVTYYEVEPLSADRIQPIPIGKPCGNSRCTAVRDDGEVVVEPGDEGLLYVRGSTVMRGYYGRAEETKRAFTDLPGVGGPESFYCTGDVVTVDEGGNFVFLGRRDHMIKTGGHRVELGEVESALFAHPSVRDAAAVAVPHDVLGNAIWAFVVADAVSEQDLRAHCGSLLPRYMVPERVEIRGRLPRTATDKVDRPRLVAEAADALVNAHDWKAGET